MTARVASSLLLLVAACSSTPPAAPSPSPPPPLEIAITVDDLPIHGPAPAGVDRVAIADRLLDAFRRHRVPPVYGFVNGKWVDDDATSEAVLRRWLGAGNPLGNHTYSHLRLGAASVPRYVADLEKGEVVLDKLAPGAGKVFRYPYLFEGETLDKREAVRAYLREHGYTIAEVSIEADDWAYNPPFVRCTERGDAAALAELRRSFVEVHLAELHAMRELTRRLAHRDVRHVLLLHVGAAEADAIEDLLTAYEREGVRWIGLGAALADPFYAIDPGLAAPQGASFPYLVARARGAPAPPQASAHAFMARLDRACR